MKSRYWFLQQQDYHLHEILPIPKDLFCGAFPYQIDELTSIVHSCSGQQQKPREEAYPKNAHTDQNFLI